MSERQLNTSEAVKTTESNVWVVSLRESWPDHCSFMPIEREATARVTLLERETKSVWDNVRNLMTTL